jgi:pyruvate ferredoxin oxidoreductase gamma subunit
MRTDEPPPRSSAERTEPLFQVRIHGRGGQGAVTAAEILSVAAFVEGRHAQAFPSFGSERTGAPVVSFCRIDEAPIRNREPIATPDALIVLDPTLLHQVDVFGGLGDDGCALINSGKDPEALGLADLARRLGPGRVLTVPATEIARQHLGRPLPNAILLGGFAAFTGIISLESVVTAIRRRFRGALGEGNAAGAGAAHDHVLKAQGAAALA